MALQQIIDATDKFNENLYYVLDCGGYDYANVQFVTPTSDINFTHTNDSGAVQGVSEGNYKSATNFTSVLATYLTDGATATKATTATEGIYKFNGCGKFIKFSSATPLTKLLIRLYKIS